MVIYVKINQSYVPGNPVIESAYGDWELAQLLDNSEFRNRYKFLIAIYKKHVVGVFIIRAVAEKPKKKGSPKRRVCFALEETDHVCKQAVLRACEEKLIHINSSQPSKGYINVVVECYDFFEEIPVLPAKEIEKGVLRSKAGMELKFIWVKKHRILDDIGFNFNHCGEHQFEFNENRLSLHPNKKSKLDFGKNISGVTAIAGENGSGKSSLCEITLLTTATRVNGAWGWDITFDGIVVYGQYIFVHHKIQLKNAADLRKRGYEVRTYKESPFEELDHQETRSFIEGGFIYYSNAFDVRSDFSAMNLANISSQHLLREDYKYSTSYPSSNPYTFEPADQHKYMEKHDPLRIHEIEQNYRSARFYLNFPEFIPFRHPDIVYLKSTYSGNNRWLRFQWFDDYELQSEYQQVLNEILTAIYPFNSVSDNEHNKQWVLEGNVIKSAAQKLYRFNLLVAKGVETRQPIDATSMRRFVFNNQLGKMDTPILKELVKEYDSLIQESRSRKIKFNPHHIYTHYRKANDWRFYLLEYHEIDNTSENRDKLKAIITLENTFLRSDHSYRRISNLLLYPMLSAGESSFMNFFSRLHDVILRYKTGTDRRNNIILFIDEADVGFHPEWSKKFFKWLIDFLNFYTSGFSFQVILTTHSPYLLSDLDSSNVILLEKKERKTSIIPPSQFKTFGSNIHELLATSFFMKDGFMGEFAKTRIENLINFFNGKNQDYDEVSSRELISLIGDEIISLRLADMHTDKFGKPKNQDKDEYETWLKQELIKLQLERQ